MDELRQARQLLQEYGLLDKIEDVEDKEAEAKFAKHSPGTALDSIKQNVEALKNTNKDRSRQQAKHIALAYRFLKLKASGIDFRQTVP